MPNYSVFDKTGKKVSDIALSDAIFAITPNASAMHLCVVAYLANQRQGTQSTLTRAEVRGGGKKPWRQKGSGRARQGSIRSPQWTHGGIALGPKPREYGKTVNKKVRRLAMKSALSSKVAAEELIVLDSLEMNEIKTKEVPALDDEFAKDVSEFDTLKELKADLKKKITGERKESAQRAFEDVLMQKVAEGITCDIPDAMVNLQAEQMANNFKQQLASQGIPFDQYLKMTGTTEADFLSQAHGPAQEQVRMDLAVEAIIKAEGLEATDDEVNAEMQKLADKYGMDLESVKKYLPAAQVREQVIREKVVKLVADSAVAVAPEAEEKKEDKAEETAE